jgi:shikimate kinase
LQQAFSNLTPPSRQNPTPRVVCLVGFMGSGKSTVGALLARQLGWRFEDLDARIEAHTGLTIPLIFEQMGEPAFRRIEAEQLETLLGQASESRSALVLALGGGTYAQPGAPEMLRASGVLAVWLDCPVELLLSRCATMTNRPLFRDEPSFRSLLAARLPFYAQADHRVAGDADPARIVEHILALEPFERLTGARDDFSLRQVKT